MQWKIRPFTAIILQPRDALFCYASFKSNSHTQSKIVYIFTRNFISVLTLFCSSPTDNKYPLHVPDDERLRAGLERNGFECNGSVCTPCHFGTYQKRINNSFVCVPCPAGKQFHTNRQRGSSVDLLTYCASHFIM